MVTFNILSLMPNVDREEGQQTNADGHRGDVALVITHPYLTVSCIWDIIAASQFLTKIYFMKKTNS